MKTFEVCSIMKKNAVIADVKAQNICFFQKIPIS